MKSFGIIKLSMFYGVLFFHFTLATPVQGMVTDIKDNFWNSDKI